MSRVEYNKINKCNGSIEIVSKIDLEMIGKEKCVLTQSGCIGISRQTNRFEVVSPITSQRRMSQEFLEDRHAHFDQIPSFQKQSGIEITRSLCHIH